MISVKRRFEFAVTCIYMVCMRMELKVEYQIPME
jgi:hypothetical protein